MPQHGNKETIMTFPTWLLNRCYSYKCHCNSVSSSRFYEVPARNYSLQGNKRNRIFDLSYPVVSWSRLHGRTVTSWSTKVATLNEGEYR